LQIEIAGDSLIISERISVLSGVVLALEPTSNNIRQFDTLSNSRGFSTLTAATSEVAINFARIRYGSRMSAASKSRLGFRQPLRLSN